MLRTTKQMTRKLRPVAVMLFLVVGTNVASPGQVPAWSGYYPSVPSLQPTPTGEELPYEKLSFVCNSSNGTANTISISPTGKLETSAEPFQGPLTLVLKYFRGKPPNWEDARWEAEVKTSVSLFDWHVVLGEGNRSLHIERNEKEIERVSISAMAGYGVPYPRTLIIERDYKNYTFLFTMATQTTEKHADELNIVTPRQRWGPTTRDQKIFWLSGNCVKREDPTSPW